MKKWIVLILLVGCSKKEPPTPHVPYVRVAKSIVCDAPLFLEYVGHVQPNLSVAIKAQVEGILTGQYFTEGQEVAKNSLLMTIDPRPFQAALEKAVGVLAENLASLEFARETVERNRPLATLNYISQLDFDQMLTNVLTAQALVEQSKADVERAEIELSYCTIQAPFQGIASKLSIDVGNYVPVGGDAPLFTINQISPIRISFFVPEKDIGRIAPLQCQEALKVHVLRGDVPVVGKLFLINNAVDEETGTILLEALFENRDKALWPGEFVDVKLILQIQKDAILVPAQAVQLGQDGPFVYVLKPDSTADLRTVKVGQKEGDNIIIESGVSPDETVVIEGQLNLTPGIKVQLKL